jgi:pyridoxal phosphate enzyme (YggS family)
MQSSDRIGENLKVIRARIAAAAQKAGRDPAGVTLIGVSKFHDADAARKALEAGLADFGENRVQEAAGKWPPLLAEFPNVRLHLVGALQSNKVAEAVKLFHAIHSLDRPKLAEALARAMTAQDVRRPCFIEVNTGEEPQKAGVLPGEADDFIRRCREDWKLPIEGLMCVPPAGANAALHFAFLAELARRHGLSGLSMGMSADFETAIALGATHVRVGTAIFGERVR